MLLYRHSEDNHLVGTVGQKPARKSKPYVITISMLGYFLPKILAPRKLHVSNFNCWPSFQLLPGAHAPVVEGSVEKL
jgi:hypothetical protein